MTTIEDYFKGGPTEIPCRRAAGVAPSVVREEVHRELTRLSNKGIELTVTFIPALSARYSPQTLTRIVRDMMMRYDIETVLIGEYSKVGTFHMHGSILGNPREISKIKRKMSKEIGRCEFKAIRFVESWVKYCMKDEYTLQDKEIVSEEIVYRIK